MKKYILIIVVMAGVICLNGCYQDKPKPESGTKEITLKNSESVTVSNSFSEKEPFFVQYLIKGKDIYIECVVTGISFRKNASQEAGAKIAIFVDGKREKEVNSAAFVIKDLSSGNHRIKMVVLTKNNRSYGQAKEFTITIP